MSRKMASGGLVTEAIAVTQSLYLAGQSLSIGKFADQGITPGNPIILGDTLDNQQPYDTMGAERNHDNASSMLL